MKILLTAADNLQNPHPKPYKGILLTVDALNTFIKETSIQKKQPIVIFGANWCPDARLLEGVLQLPTVKKLLNKNCIILNVDVGDYETNIDLFKFFDPAIREGIPRVFIMSLDGDTLNLELNDKMRTARDMTPQEIFNYFQNFIN
jgi:hypothetical protein